MFVFGYNSPFVERYVSPNQISQWIQQELEQFNNRIDNYTRDSDLVFVKFTHLSVQFSYTKKVRGSSYLPLPEEIKKSKSCINIKNDDNQCFRWALLSWKHYDEINNNHKSESKTYKKYKNEFLLPSGCSYPVEINEIHKWEKAYKIKVNVYRIDKGEPQSIYNTIERNENVVNLLLIESQNNNHYVWIRNLATLVLKNNNKEKLYFCSQCLRASYRTMKS